MGLESQGVKAAPPNTPLVQSRASRSRRGLRSRFHADQPIPYVTYTLLIVMVALFAAMYVLGHSDPGRVGRAFGAKDNDLIRAGEIWRLITPIFLHGNLLHLLTNSLSLIWMGGQMERLYGARKYFLIYIAAGVAGNIASFLCSPNPSLGASGALFGLIGAGLVFPLRFRQLIPPKVRSQILSQLLTVAVVNLGIGASLRGIVDNSAHIGGLLGGGFMALFLIPDALEAEAPSRLHDRALSAAAACTLAIVIWAGLAQWRSPKTELFVGQNGWWQVEVPETWQQVGRIPASGVWRSPEGAWLQALDSVPRLQRADIDVYLRQALSPQARRLTIVGKPAWHVFSRNENTKRVLDLYLIEVYPHVLILKLDCLESTYAKTRRDFERVIASLRFLHAPPLPAPTEAPDDVETDVPESGEAAPPVTPHAIGPH